MRLPSMTLKRLLLAGNNFTAIAGLIFSDYFNKILINDKRGNIDSIKLIINEKKYHHSSIIFLVNKFSFYN